MSLLSIITGACGELSLEQPSAVYTATDTQTQQLLALADKEGKELARRFDWQILQKEGTFTTVATETQVAAITTTYADFNRVVNESMWDRTQGWQIVGPLNAQQWQRRKAAFAQAGTRYYFRIRGNALLFNPVPAAGNSVYFEYLSSKWCQSSGGTAQTAWAADNDTALIDEEVIRLGVVWRFLKAKGLDYAEEFRTYELALVDLFGADAGKQIIDMTNDDGPFLGANIPDANWDLS